jgi:hypothetical protein
MNPVVILSSLLLTVTAFAADDKTPAAAEPPEGKPQITYYDRNGDGKVDLEKHHYPRGADMDWELRDDDYNGRYEVKVLYGFAVTKAPIDQPVPTNVTIEKEKKP